MELSEPAFEPMATILGPVDIDEAAELSAMVGWNQVAADWRMMLHAGQGFGYRTPDGQLVATAVILPYTERFGWVSMVIVAPEWQRRGLASSLLRTGIGALETQSLVPVLDATPAGQKVYAPLGFKPLFPLARWQRGNGGGKVPGGPGLDAPDLAALLAYDREVFGGDRSAILEMLAGRSGGLVRLAPGGRGYLVAREGRLATHIGPICADDRAWALDALEEALEAAKGSLFIDVPDHQEDVQALLRRRGFEVQRPFLRMARGNMEGIGIPGRMFAVAGPELG